MSSPPLTVQATFVATLVDEWARAGVTHAVVCPGSRSAPLALALLAEARIEVTVRLDERSAAFTALGIGLASGRPAVLCTTSGTAAAEAHAAVVEADLAGVPMIVCTADRPIELQRVGAPQTIDQRDLYGRAVRAFVDLGALVGEEPAQQQAWRSVASRTVLDALLHPSGPGPVHVNLPLRDPLLAGAGELPPGRPGGAPWHAFADGPPGPAARHMAAPDPAAIALLALCDGASRVLVVAGGPLDLPPGGGLPGQSPAAPPAALAIARALRAPLLADPRCAPRKPGEELVLHPDQVLRSNDARVALAPEVVVHLGVPHASKVLASWWGETSTARTRHVLVDPFGRFADPERRAELVLRAHPAVLAEGLHVVAAASAAPGPGGHPGERAAPDPAGHPGERAAPASPPAATYLTAWRAADDAVEAMLDERLAPSGELSEPSLARGLFASLPAGSSLVVASSMPVRDLEWFAGARHDPPAVFANRGVNGIDGVVSTALGVALAAGTGAQAAGDAGRAGGAGGRAPAPLTAALVGDLAFLHDLTALVHGRDGAVPPLAVVVADNAGGGIFSFLAYAAELERDTFERAFGTPQGANPVLVASALGHAAEELRSLEELEPALRAAQARGGITVLAMRSDREANRLLHDDLASASAAAAERALGLR